MTHSDILAHFGSGSLAAIALGVSRQRVHNWRKHGVPLGMQYQVEIATKGALRASKPASTFNRRSTDRAA